LCTRTEQRLASHDIEVAMVLRLTCLRWRMASWPAPRSVDEGLDDYCS
jgi:hypothetical protein